MGKIPFKEELVYMENYYGVLGLDSQCSEEEIKRAYGKLVKKFTPENSPEEYKKLKSVYEKLKNKETRVEYDLQLGFNNRLLILKEEYEKLRKDQRVIESLKECIYIYINDGKKNEKVIKVKGKEILEKLRGGILSEPEVVFKGIKIIEKEYSILYGCREELFKLIGMELSEYLEGI